MLCRVMMREEKGCGQLEKDAVTYMQSFPSEERHPQWSQILGTLPLELSLCLQ